MRPGCPVVAWFRSPGTLPTAFRMTKLSARPTVRFARFPAPRTAVSVLNPSRSITGPWTTTRGAAPPVLAEGPTMLKRSSRIAFTTARTTGNISSLHPAITVLAAICCTVITRCRSTTRPTVSSGARSHMASIPDTRDAVGGMIGRPSVQPY